MLSVLLNFNYRTFLQLLLANIGIVPQLASLAEAFVNAGNWQSRWDILHEIGNLLLKATPLAEDTFTTASVDDEAELERQVMAKMAEGQVSAQAFDGRRLRKLFDVIQPFLPILIGLIQAK